MAVGSCFDTNHRARVLSFRPTGTLWVMVLRCRGGAVIMGCLTVSVASPHYMLRMHTHPAVTAKTSPGIPEDKAGPGQKQDILES